MPLHGVFKSFWGKNERLILYIIVAIGALAHSVVYKNVVTDIHITKF